ncbi:hypothetical protein [Streptomyces sp. ST2-7A]|uniref:hypothetical protein n=1 Tax=Streptomyces sp. ST2-7A TaxID=2907214 RepID=UPI001F434DE4|nr:hypothetical protein [Streptomyces sp. ST2-7A]MCE7079976.1 hypothetical protein [Streptomyces sp. ST2-7A]
MSDSPVRRRKRTPKKCTHCKGDGFVTVPMKPTPRSSTTVPQQAMCMSCLGSGLADS